MEADNLKSKKIRSVIAFIFLGATIAIGALIIPPLLRDNTTDEDDDDLNGNEPEVIPDEDAPVITLLTPDEDAFVLVGALVNLTISDENLDTVLYQWNGIASESFDTLYSTNIPTGYHTQKLSIFANDTSGNSIIQNYSFLPRDISGVYGGEMSTGGVIRIQVDDYRITGYYFDGSGSSGPTFGYVDKSTGYFSCTDPTIDGQFVYDSSTEQIVLSGNYLYYIQTTYYNPYNVVYTEVSGTFTELINDGSSLW